MLWCGVGGMRAVEWRWQPPEHAAEGRTLAVGRSRGKGPRLPPFAALVSESIPSLPSDRIEAQAGEHYQRNTFFEAHRISQKFGSVSKQRKAIVAREVHHTAGRIAFLLRSRVFRF